MSAPKSNSYDLGAFKKYQVAISISSTITRAIPRASGLGGISDDPVEKRRKREEMRMRIESKTELENL